MRVVIAMLCKQKTGCFEDALPEAFKPFAGQ